MNDTHVPAHESDAVPSGKILDELNLTVHRANRHDGDPVSLTGEFQRFARSARREGVLAERVVIALKRTYQRLMPPQHPDWTSRLARLISLSIDSYYRGEHEEIGDLRSTSRSQPSTPDAA